MFLHYNNGEKEKLIKDILSIQIIDGNTPAIITLKSGGELRIRLDRIEMIVDDSGLELKVLELKGAKQCLMRKNTIGRNTLTE